jgi:hypothetical protein
MLDHMDRAGQEGGEDDREVLAHPGVPEGGVRGRVPKIGMMTKKANRDQARPTAD